MKKFFLFSFLLTVLICGLYLIKPKPKVFKTELASQTLDKNLNIGPIEDCLLNSKLYNRDQKIVTECTENYVHFFSKTVSRKTESLEKLRISSFNLFHLGDNQAPLKHLPIVAEIINQWDLVGAQELMPLPNTEAIDNSLIGKMMDIGEVHFPFENWKVVIPGYIRLLQELHKLDSSWSLILQSIPEGEGSTGEMAGYFYRSSRVQIKEWDYCPVEQAINLITKKPAKNLGCLVQIDKAHKKLISRTAFASYFKSGQFDFVALTIHNRYRPVLEASALKEQASELCKYHADSKKCKYSKDSVGRYYEVFAVSEQIPIIKKKAKDKDIIFMGDFNLEILKSTAPLWKSSLKSAPGLTPYQTEPTTVSIKGKKMASNYDHFLIDPALTKACDPNSIKAYHFVRAGLEFKDPTSLRIRELLKENEQIKWLQTSLDDLEGLVRVELRGEDSIRPLNPKERADAEDSLKSAFERARVNDYAAVLEFLSDHIPIELHCRTNMKDDD